uniref:Uncharacterized protein n=1 Tax=Arundo donax TaxID=35708 RepID=A0A0A9G6G2_ARUDO
MYLLYAPPPCSWVSQSISTRGICIQKLDQGTRHLASYLGHTCANTLEYGHRCRSTCSSIPEVANSLD